MILRKLTFMVVLASMAGPVWASGDGGETKSDKKAVEHAKAQDLLAESSENAPWKLIRTLQFVQDNVAYGKPGVLNLQRKLKTKLFHELMRADLKVWESERNVSSVLVYLLSGGDPRVGISLIKNGVSYRGSDVLLRGATAYGLDRHAEAAKYFSKVNIAQLPMSLAAYVTFSKALLLAKKDAKAADKLLDEVRLMVPGGLLEEAALRRQVQLAGRMADVDRLEGRIRQYLNHYNGSVYMRHFIMQLVKVIAPLDYGSKPERLVDLEQSCSHLKPNLQLQFYLALARSQLLRGHQNMVQFAANNAEKLSQPGSPEKNRAEFYQAAINIVNKQSPKALLKLEKTDASILPANDKKLLAAASYVVKQIREWPEKNEKLEKKIAALNLKKDSDHITMNINRAQNLIAQIDQLEMGGAK